MSQASDSRLTSEEGYRNIFEAASDGLVIYPGHGTELTIRWKEIGKKKDT